jgi:competence protein ComEC
MSTIYLSCACLLGIFLGSAFYIPISWAFIGLLPLPLVFVLPGRKKIIILSSLCIIAIFLCASHSYSQHNQSVKSNLQSFIGTGTVVLKGMVDREPELGPANARVYLSISGIYINEKWLPASGTTLLYTSRYPEYLYGDILQVKGKLEGKPGTEPRNPAISPEVEGYWAYLATLDVYFTISYPRIEILERNKGILPVHWLYGVRDRMAQTLVMVLPEPHAALAQGMTLGMRTNIPPELNDAFSRSGTTHILAISGVNLTMVAGILVSLTIRLFGRRRFIYIWVTLIIVWLYSWLTGLNPPVLRAAVMFSFFLAADLVGRQRHSVIALMLAAALMMIFNPLTLSSVSFQLSFMAMTGLVFLCPPIQSLVRKVVDRIIDEGKIRQTVYLVTDSFSVSFGAVIATWPLMAYYFGLVSWVGPLATFVTLPVMPAIIITGILTGGVGALFLPVGQVIAWLAWLPLTYLIIAAQAFSDIPGSSLKIMTMTPATIILYYALLALVLVSLQHRKKFINITGGIAMLISRIPKKWAIPPLLIIAVMAWLFFATMPDNKVHISFLDVGQGDAILIETGLQQVLVDGGPDARAAILEISKKMPFWDRTIDAVILTHPDVDHLCGLIEVLERYRVRYIFSADLSDNSTLFREWMKAIDDHKIEHAYIVAGQLLNLGSDTKMTVLNPPAMHQNTNFDINNASVVLRLDINKISFLLTGDIGTQSEIEMVSRRATLHSTVLKVAHHGSGHSTGDIFLDVVNPDIAVISVGEKNKYGHPDEDVVDRLSRKLGENNIFRTDEDGTIEFITDGEKLWVSTGKK